MWGEHVGEGEREGPQGVAGPDNAMSQAVCSCRQSEVPPSASLYPIWSSRPWEHLKLSDLPVAQC